MPALQFLNLNKQFKLFTDTSKQSYSGILHQEKTPDIPDSEPELIPIAYFWDLSAKLNSYGIQLRKNVMQFIDQYRYLLSTLQPWSAHYTVTINP